MIRIDHLRIRLPAHLHKEANRFAALLGDALSRAPVEHEIRARRISVPNIQIAKSADVRTVASHVADRILRSVRGGDV